MSNQHGDEISFIVDDYYSTETSFISDPKNNSDPLENFGDDIEESKVYRLNLVVFAEPLGVKDNVTSTLNNDSKIIEMEDRIIVDNVSFIERKGKRRKYNMNIGQSNLSCPQQYCHKVFSSTTLLKAHIRKVHCSEKNFVCEKCGSSFTAQYLLKRHYLVHTDQKIQCPVCNKMLSRRTNLQVHLRSHADTRPHECSTCHKRFLRKSTMKVHCNFVHKFNGK